VLPAQYGGRNTHSRFGIQLVTGATASALHILRGRRRSAAPPSAICRQMRKIAEHRIADRDQPVTNYILEGPTVIVVSARLEF
jgi:hypothetical protein